MMACLPELGRQLEQGVEMGTFGRRMVQIQVPPACLRTPFCDSSRILPDKKDRLQAEMRSLSSAGGSARELGDAIAVSAPPATRTPARY